MRRAGVIVLTLMLAGCAGMHSSSDTAGLAELKNASGQSVGTARFTQAGNVVRILVETTGMPPGTHAVHVHSVGKCDPPDFTSAGPHFNPTNKKHGLKNKKEGLHAGDMQNFTVGTSGRAAVTLQNSDVTLDQLSVNGGTALVIAAATGQGVPEALRAIADVIERNREKAEIEA